MMPPISCYNLNGEAAWRRHIIEWMVESRRHAITVVGHRSSATTMKGWVEDIANEFGPDAGSPADVARRALAEAGL